MCPAWATKLYCSQCVCTWCRLHGVYTFIWKLQTNFCLGSKPIPIPILIPIPIPIYYLSRNFCWYYYKYFATTYQLLIHIYLVSQYFDSNQYFGYQLIHILLKTELDWSAVLVTHLLYNLSINIGVTANKTCLITMFRCCLCAHLMGWLVPPSIQVDISLLCTLTHSWTLFCPWPSWTDMSCCFLPSSAPTGNFNWNWAEITLFLTNPNNPPNCVSKLIRLA